MDYRMEDAINGLVAAIDRNDPRAAHEALDRFADAVGEAEGKISPTAFRHRVEIARTLHTRRAA